MAKPVSIPESVFMLGVGGMGMAPLAVFLAQAGCNVTGVDDALQPSMRELLERHGVRIESTSELPEVEAVVFSSAVSRDNKFLSAALDRGLEVYRRGEMLSRLAADYKLVAVAGSHGKTTTTAMLIHFLTQSEIPFSYVLGARFRNDALPPARFDPAGEWLIAEIDESDGTIEHFSPEVTVFVNFDWDHADLYETPEHTRAAFMRLSERTESAVVLPADCEAHLTEPDGGKVHLIDHVDGDFNQMNAALASAAFQHISGLTDEPSLAGFPGIARRQDMLHQDKKLSILADYAHHPVEINALLGMIRSQCEDPIIVIFQPHRYTRTAAFAQEFAEALDIADHVILLPVYAASEVPLDHGQSEQILNHAKGDWVFAESSELIKRLSDRVAEIEKATVLFVGAGDIDQMANRFVDAWSLRNDLLKGLSSDSIIKLAEPLARRTTLRVGGPARFWAEPSTVEDLQCLLRNAAQAELATFFIGRGSNLVVSDEGFDGLVISLSAPAFRQIEILDDGRFKVGGGLRLKELCGAVAKAGKSGFEFLEGIPGTVGGSLKMNAGAMGGWIFDVVDEVEFITASGECHVYPKESFHVGYRHCSELKEAIAVSAILRASNPMQSDEIRRQMDTYANKRKESQPREPSAGCIFKNPEGNYAGKLVDELGLKGTAVGGAEVSDVHGNFIVNRNHATSEDVINLVRVVREKILEERGILLEPEVLLVGQTWKEVLA
ncbi:UDP-N-acetylmuramate dehydrogenase [Rubellicoccus peritrichatus]|uniref:UDP-N-acetylenolpyruvoylglucosamine reductase n=1 Tax=Rubellicoccus peritrichatus TaxID=3080537 RepID=A0AAQ3LFE7_9BACT|nr:UDP-N-acetylmuramate dehydrogenase [Puniceicoccus sp. CR14]WOO43554.1 UDP-N-acetylmuramate dehydrogenase [Puniceicoccus sp. CR14]